MRGKTFITAAILFSFFALPDTESFAVYRCGKYGSGFEESRLCIPKGKGAVERVTCKKMTKAPQSVKRGKIGNFISFGAPKIIAGKYETHYHFGARYNSMKECRKDPSQYLE